MLYVQVYSEYEMSKNVLVIKTKANKQKEKKIKKEKKETNKQRKKNKKRERKIARK